jgi:NAD(P)-dependent dehydrogenase (short-subunit alcohol dehydrogenase family)
VRVVVIGATGTIGKAIVAALSSAHEVVPIAQRSGEFPVDFADPGSISRMYAGIGRVDAVVVAAGLAKFGPFATLTEADYRLGLDSKLMGQVNVVRLGVESVSDGGSFTLTSGILAGKPSPGGAAISPVNAAIEGFARAAALELPRGIRINAVSPGWVSETLSAMGRDPGEGTPVAEVARAYVASVEGSQTGKTIDVPG